MSKWPVWKLTLILVVSLLAGCAGSPPSGLAIDGSCRLTISNRSPDSLRIALENWQLFPLQAQTVDTTLPAGEELPLTLLARNNANLTITLNEEAYGIFLRPAAESGLEYTGAAAPRFTGDLAAVNAFLLRRSEYFGSPDADWKPRANFTHGAYSTEALLAANDSITTEQVRFLREHATDLPDEYVSFETRRLRYLNAGFQLNSIFYRKTLLGHPEPVPPDLLPRVLSDLPIEDEELLGNMRYNFFLSDYLSFLLDPDMQRPPPDGRQDWMQRYEQRFALVDTTLTGLVRDVYLANMLEHIILEKPYLYQEEWMALIEHPPLVEHLQHLQQSQPALAAGTPVPGFVLKTPDGTRVTAKDYLGQVTLINFWATWCRPCIREFPRENELVRQFADEPVRIVNICMDSQEETWRRMIAEHELRTDNLFAAGSWRDRLYERFAITSLPHSILIDAAGNVVQNNCPRASDGIDAHFRSLLAGMAGSEVPAESLR